jgi:hypothetical protein
VTNSFNANSRAPWLAASAIWMIAGLIFPLLAPATLALQPGFQRYLVSVASMSEEMAFYVAFTVFRIPLTALLGILLAAAQCALVPGVRPFTQRWVISAAIGACISTLIFLPSSLVVRQTVGDTFLGAMILLLTGPGLLGGLVSFVQSKAVRGRILVPGWFVAGCIAAAVPGALAATFVL